MPDDIPTISHNNNSDSQGEAPPIGQVIVTLLANGGLRIGITPGLTTDVVERTLYGALKHVERQLLAAQVGAARPRIEGVRGMLPRFGGRG